MGLTTRIALLLVAILAILFLVAPLFDRRADVVQHVDLVRVSAARLLARLLPRSISTAPTWLIPTANSLIIAFAAMLLTMLLVMPAAFGYRALPLRREGRLINLLLMTPLIVPHVVSALGYYGLLSRLGSLRARISGSSSPRRRTGDSGRLPGRLRGAQGFDRNLERAAMSAGAGPLRTFFWVTLPVLRPGILVGALFAFLQTFNEAVVAIFIAGRDAATLPKKMFESIRLESDPVIAVVSTLLTSALSCSRVVILGPLPAKACARRPDARGPNPRGLPAAAQRRQDPMTAGPTRSTTCRIDIKRGEFITLARAERFGQDHDADDDRRLRRATHGAHRARRART